MSIPQDKDYEVIIIGGGITGATIARDCAMRGFRVLLLEKKDFSCGTTGACTGMIHGGMQYVISEFEMTELSCIESGIFQREAPHLIFRIPSLHPIFTSIEETGQFGNIFETYSQIGVHKNSHHHIMLTAEEALELEPNLNPKIKGAITGDEPGIDTFRFVMANINAAAELGATIRNHAQVMDILRLNGQVYGVRVRDTLTGEECDYYAACVVNAAGPWTPWVAALAEIPFRLRPIKGSHIVFDRRITTCGVSGTGSTVLPHENGTICGIANAFYFQNPDEVVANNNEVEELIAGVEMSLPIVRQLRVIRTYSGVRPTLPDEKSKDQRAVSRNYQIFDHEELQGVKGFITIAGGKMVISRKMAEDLTDLLCKKFGRDIPCRTKEEFLPGGEKQLDPAELAEEYNMPIHAVTRLVHRHGARAEQILDDVRSMPQHKSHVCLCEPVTEAEIRYTIRHEWVRTLDDLRRRVRLAMGPCQGMHCTAVAEGILVDELKRPSAQAHRDVLEFIQKRWRSRHPGLGGTQLRQEELIRACYLGVGNYHNPDLERTSKW
jgi:glycerol-3-phosphate dehydrogenase